MNLLLMILQGADLIATEVVPIADLIARIKSYFELNPSATVNIQTLESDALQADADTLQTIANWQKAHGLPVTVDPSAAAPPPTPITDAKKS
jgi:hypothetical protein